MNKKLINILSKYPKLYEKSSSNYWDEDYISKEILKAHLSYNVDSASRNLEFIKKSVDFIVNLNKNKSNVKLLDLGCGPGLYANLFLEYDYEIVGIDFSKVSIDYAKSKVSENDKVTFIYDNYLNIDYNNEFDVVILLYHDFGTLTRDDRLLLLKKVYKSLKSGGMFIVDGFSFKHLDKFIEKETFSYEQIGFWKNDPYVVFERFKHYKSTNNILEQYVVLSNDDISTYNIFNQIFDSDTLTLEFNKTKFNTLKFYDDVVGSRLSNNSDSICVVAYKD